jgi:hypothetical protein
MQLQNRTYKDNGEENTPMGLQLAALSVNVLFTRSRGGALGGMRMRRMVVALVKDRRGVLPIEYLHVVTLVTAASVTAIHFFFK